MYLAAAAATATTSNFNTFDIFMLLFTIVIAIGLVRLVGQHKKNIFAIGWSAVCLLVFLVIDYIMIFKVWMG
jgi:hypothetical protein